MLLLEKKRDLLTGVTNVVSGLAACGIFYFLEDGWLAVGVGLGFLFAGHLLVDHRLDKIHSREMALEHLPGGEDGGEELAHGSFSSPVSASLPEAISRSLAAHGSDARELVIHWILTESEPGRAVQAIHRVMVEEERVGREELTHYLLRRCAAILACDDEKFHAEGQLPEKIRGNAQKTFLGRLLAQEEKWLLFYDSTLLGRGDDGFVMGLSGIAWRNFMEESFFRAYGDMGYIELEDGTIHFDPHHEGECIEMAGAYDRSCHAVANLLAVLKRVHAAS